MANEQGITRINLRVPNELFRKLDDKRHAQHATFQEIGLRLFEGWLSGTIPSDVDRSPDLSQNSASVASANGPSTPVSPDQVRQILDEYEARLLERLEAATQSGKSRNPQPKRRAKGG